MNLNKKGFTLVESLFSFSVFITVIILLASLYVTNSQTNIRISNEYTDYQKQEQIIEQTLNIEEGINQCLEKVLHS